MAHAKAEYGRRKVLSNLLLLGIEPHALRNVPVAVQTEDAEGHLEADRLGRAVHAWRLLLVQLVARVDSFVFGWDITSRLG